MRLPVWRQKPIYGHFLSAGWEVGSTFYEHCVFLSCVKNYRDRRSDRQSEKEAEKQRKGNEETGRKMYGVWSG